MGATRWQRSGTSGPQQGQGRQKQPRPPKAERPQTQKQQVNAAKKAQRQAHRVNRVGRNRNELIIWFYTFGMFVLKAVDYILVWMYRNTGTELVPDFQSNVHLDIVVAVCVVAFLFGSFWMIRWTKRSHYSADQEEAQTIFWAVATAIFILGSLGYVAYEYHSVDRAQQHTIVGVMLVFTLAFTALVWVSMRRGVIGKVIADKKLARKNERQRNKKEREARSSRSAQTDSHGNPQFHQPVGPHPQAPRGGPNMAQPRSPMGGQPQPRPGAGFETDLDDLLH